MEQFDLQTVFDTATLHSSKQQLLAIMLLYGGHIPAQNQMIKVITIT